ncbi:MAG TPA: hypothetical protein VGM90_39910 [Kofleriaceae bacterium]
MRIASHHPVTVAVAPPVVVKPVVKSAAKPDLAAMLKQLGTRLHVDLDAAYPAIGSSEPYPATDSEEQPPGKIFATEPCARPDDKERAAITKRVRATVDSGAWLSFGCEDRNGIVVDATFDTAKKRRDGGTDLTGHWKILRVSAKKITTLYTLDGESSQNWMEWSNEQSVSTWALVDLDGDGVHDIISLRTVHEGGSSSSDIDVELRRSSDNKLITLGSFTGLRDCGFARGSTSTLVLHTSTLDDEWNEKDAHYQCLASTGLTDCPAAAEAARIDHAVQIADWFVAGHAYAPADSALPDRDQLGEMLDVARVTGDERARLLAAADETPASYRIKREIDAKLAVRAGLPETRPAQLAAALGDTACTKCAYKVVTTTKNLPEQRLQRTDRLVYAGKVLASVTVRGPAFTCSACGFGPPEQQFEINTYRHGASTVALVYRPASMEEDSSEVEKRASTLTDRTVNVFVDGKLVDQLPDGGDYPWYKFDQNAFATDLAKVNNTLVHWPAVPAAAIQYLADETARTDATERLAGFDVTQWANSAYRDQIVRDRALVGI